MGTALTLTGTVAPENATNKTIVWSVKAGDENTAGGTIAAGSSTLNTTQAGSVTVIANGATASTAYTKDFTITVSAAGSGTVVSDVNLSSLVTAPVAGVTPSTAAINVNQYTGTIAWKTNTGAAHSGNFAVSAVYQAEVSLAAKTGFTFAGIAAGTFTYSGATSVTHSAGTGTSLTVTITFPATDSGIAAPPPPAGELKTLTLNDVAVNMRYVPAGKFQRDATAANVSVITKGYWLAETETTQELFQAVMGINPSYFDGTSGKEAAEGETQNKRPVEQVNWYHAIAFCNKLSIANGKQAVYSVNGISDWAALQYSAIPTTDNTDWDAASMDTSKNGYRLPTEMEWMWAAMGADKTSQPNTTGYSKTYAGSVESGITNIGNYAWSRDNSDDKTHEVGKKTANELGLKDMSGNVWEWCWDRYGIYPANEQTDFTGAGAASGSKRMIRGGAWYADLSDYAVANRLFSSPKSNSSTYGFRFACR